MNKVKNDKFIFGVTFLRASTFQLSQNVLKLEKDRRIWVPCLKLADGAIE